MASTAAACAWSSCCSVIWVTGRRWPKLGWLIDLWNVAASVGFCLDALMAWAKFFPLVFILLAASADALDGHIGTPNVTWASWQS